MVPGNVGSVQHSWLATPTKRCFSGTAPARQNLHQRDLTAHAKKNIHPKYFDDSKVICNGEEVLTTSGTKSQYTVEVWSGNHPFYQGANSATLQQEGRVSAFNKRFQGLEESWGKAGVSTGGALKYEGAKKAKPKGKGKK